jgi:hypothetical protein
VDNAVKSSTKGMRPNLAKGKATPETIDPVKLSTKLNNPFNSGRLQEAVGDDVAERLLQHSDNAERAAARVKSTKNLRNKAGYVAATGAATTLGLSGVHHAFGGGK